MNVLTKAVKSVKVVNQVSKSNTTGKKERQALGEALSKQQLEGIEELFIEADADGNGTLDIDEFVNTLGPVFGNPGREKLMLMFRRMDANLDGEVDWDEFSTYMLLQSASGEKEEVEGSKFGVEHVADGNAATGHGNHAAHISQIVYSEQHQRYYTGSIDGTVRAWNAAHNMAHVRTIYNDDGWINDLCLLPLPGDFELLAVATNRHVSFYTSGAFELRGRVQTTAPVEQHTGGRDLEPPPMAQRAHRQARGDDMGEYERTVEEFALSTFALGPAGAGVTRQRTTCPQCLHAWMDDDKCVLAVGDDAGQVTLFSPPDPEDPNHANAVMITKVEHMPLYWKHAQVMDWVRGQKLGEAVVEAFRAEEELTGADLIRLRKEGKPAVAGVLGITKSSSADSLLKKIGNLLDSSNPLHSDWVTKMQYVQSETTFLLSSSKDNTLMITDLVLPKDDNGSFSKKEPPIVRKRRCLNDKSQAHLKGILDFAWCPGFKQIATCGIEREVQLWSPYGIQVGKLGPHSGSTLAVAVNDQKSQIICLSADNIISVWDHTNNRLVQSIDHEAEVAEHVASLPKQRQLPFMDIDRSIQQKEEAVAEAARQARGGSSPNENKVNALHFNEETGQMMTGTLKLVAWQTKAEALANKTERSHGAPVCCGAYNPYMQQVVSCDDDSNILVWDFETGELSYRIDDAHSGSKISAMAFDDDGACLLTGGHDGCVKLWNLSTGKLLKEMVRPSRLQNDLREVTTLLFRSTNAGSYIIAGGWDRQVTLWADEQRKDVLDTRIPKQKCYRQLEGHAVDIRCLAFYHPNTLASGSDDGEIILWNMDSGFVKHKLVDLSQKRSALQTPNSRFYSAAKSQAVEQIAFLPQSAIVVGCYADGWLRFWDSNRGALLLRQNGAVAPHYMAPMSVMVYPTNAEELHEGKRFLVTGDAGGGVQQWDVTAWDDAVSEPPAAPPPAGLTPRRFSPEIDAGSRPVQLKRHWQAHTGACLSLEYVPGNEARQPLILSSGQDGDVTLWTLNGARAGVFSSRRTRSWTLHRPATFLELRCTSSLPIEQPPSRPPTTSVGGGARERAAAAEAAAESSMAGLFAGGGGRARGGPAAGDGEDAPGHDAEAQRIFEQLQPTPPSTASSKAGQKADNMAGRLVLNTPSDSVGVGRSSDLEEVGDNWLAERDLAPAVVDSFRRPRGGEARKRRDERRLEHAQAAVGTGGLMRSGSMTARARLQTRLPSSSSDGGVLAAASSLRDSGAQTARVQPQLAHGWTQKFTADGAPYYENAQNKAAQFERPTARGGAERTAKFTRRPGSYLGALEIDRHRLKTPSERLERKTTSDNLAASIGVSHLATALAQPGRSRVKAVGAVSLMGAHS